MGNQVRRYSFSRGIIEGQENDAPELKTEQNIALLKEFLAIKGESRAVEEIPSHEFIIYTVRKKEDNNRL